MSRIATTDRTAMDALYSKAVRAGAKSAGIVDKDLPTNTETAFKDHKNYVDTVEAILKEDKAQSFDPNDPTLD